MRITLFECLSYRLVQSVALTSVYLEEQHFDQ